MINSILVKDGGIGTALLPSLGGLAVCDLLNIHAPEHVLAMHRTFKAAGAHILTSNTFLCDPDSLQNTDFKDSYQELSCRGAELARQIAGSDCLVAGSLGPGWKSPVRGEISKAELSERYYRRAVGLLQGQVDLLWIETVYDPYQAEAAVQGCLQARQEFKTNVKIAVLASQTATANDDSLINLLQELNQLPIDILGINCSSGPQSMVSGFEWLKLNSDKELACCPNAGEIDTYLSPHEFAQGLLTIQSDCNIHVLGGCCGVTYKHIQELAIRLF